MSLFFRYATAGATKPWYFSQSILVTLALSIMLLGEPFTWRLALGSSLIVAGLLVLAGSRLALPNRAAKNDCRSRAILFRFQRRSVPHFTSYESFECTAGNLHLLGSVRRRLFTGSPDRVDYVARPARHRGVDTRHADIWLLLGASTPTVLVNGVPFLQQTTIVAPAGLNFNSSYNNLEAAVDLYQVPLGAGNNGLSQILDGQTWGLQSGGLNPPLTITGLTSGQQYQLQYMISDDRLPNFRNARNYDVSDSDDLEGFRDIERAYHSTAGGGLPPVAPLGSREAKIFTGLFTADGSGTQNIYNWLYADTTHGATNSGTQVNAIQVRLIPEPSTFALGAGAAGLLGLRRRRRT